jgi:hypothetical protein
VAEASIRQLFEGRFGADQAEAIVAAAEEHANGTNSENRGSDPFKWALLITIGYECWSKHGYRDYHGITAPADEIKAWVIANANLGDHDGDCDYLCALAGGYDEYVASAA